MHVWVGGLQSVVVKSNLISLLFVCGFTLEKSFMLSSSPSSSSTFSSSSPPNPLPPLPKHLLR